MKVKQVRPKDSSDSSNAESMALIINWTHLMFNIWHFIPLSQIIIILSYLKNSLHYFMSIKIIKNNFPSKI